MDVARPAIPSRPRTNRHYITAPRRASGSIIPFSTLALAARATGIGQGVITMPVYEFICRDCQKPFEVVHPIGQPHGDVKCPGCGSRNVDRDYRHIHAITSRKS
jgi:putative FmdB family regulatory protein